MDNLVCLSGMLLHKHFVYCISTKSTRLLGIVLQPASRFDVALLAEASPPNFIQLNPTCPVAYCIVFPPVWCNTTNLQNDVMPSPSPRTMAPPPPSTHAHAPHLDPIAPYPTWNKHHIRYPIAIPALRCRTRCKKSRGRGEGRGGSPVPCRCGVIARRRVVIDQPGRAGVLGCDNPGPAGLGWAGAGGR